jgi:hypothetical protein
VRFTFRVFRSLLVDLWGVFTYIRPFPFHVTPTNFTETQTENNTIEALVMAKKKTATSEISIVTGENASICRPFTIEFRLTAPEAGFKILVVVEKGCTPTAESTLKLVFDLFKKVGGQFVEIVHVSFTAQSPVEKKGLETIAADGVPPKSARVLRQEVFPVAKRIEGRPPTEGEKVELKRGMSKAAVTAVDV